jgi:hypothetical protein
LVLGETYLILGLTPKPHLWVVSTLPAADGSIVVINMTSQRTGSDTNCIIQPGEHSFVQNATVMEYERARILTKGSQDTIDTMPAKCPRKAPVSNALLKRIQEGALTSDLTAENVKDAIRTSVAAQATGTP